MRFKARSRFWLVHFIQWTNEQTSKSRDQGQCLNDCMEVINLLETYMRNIVKQFGVNEYFFWMIKSSKDDFREQIHSIHQATKESTLRASQSMFSYVKKKLLEWNNARRRALFVLTSSDIPTAMEIIDDIFKSSWCCFVKFWHRDDLNGINCIEKMTRSTKKSKDVECFGRLDSLDWPIYSQMRLHDGKNWVVFPSPFMTYCANVSWRFDQYQEQKMGKKTW